MTVTIHYTNEHDRPARHSFTFNAKDAALEFINAPEPIKMRSDEYMPRHRVHRYTVGCYWTDNESV